MDGIQGEKNFVCSSAQNCKIKLLLKKPDEYWEHIIWSDETKIHLFGSDGVQGVWCEPGQDYHSECIVLPRVKDSGGECDDMGLHEWQVISGGAVPPVPLHMP